MSDAESFTKAYVAFLRDEGPYPQDLRNVLGSVVAGDLAYAVKLGFDAGGVYGYKYAQQENQHLRHRSEGDLTPVVTRPPDPGNQTKSSVKTT